MPSGGPRPGSGRKKGDPNHHRRGNGAGWGGAASNAPARGAAQSGEDAEEWQGKRLPAEIRAEKDARLSALKDRLFHLAFHAEREETQVAAANHYLNREEGLPVARQITANVDDVAQVLRIEIIDEPSAPATDGAAAVTAARIQH